MELQLLWILSKHSVRTLWKHYRSRNFHCSSFQGSIRSSLTFWACSLCWCSGFGIWRLACLDAPLRNFQKKSISLALPWPRTWNAPLLCRIRRPSSQVSWCSLSPKSCHRFWWYFRSIFWVMACKPWWSLLWVHCYLPAVMVWYQVRIGRWWICYFLVWSHRDSRKSWSLFLPWRLCVLLWRNVVGEAWKGFVKIT